jgi:hypothetical protein
MQEVSVSRDSSAWVLLAAPPFPEVVHSEALCRYGTKTQRAAYLPRLTTMDALASYCLTEPGSGSDAGACWPARLHQAPPSPLHSHPAADGANWRAALPGAVAS